MRERPWLILSHAFNMDGRAASQTITDKIPHLRALGVEPIVVSAVTGARDALVEHHQLLPIAPGGLRFDARFLLRRRLKDKALYNSAVGLMTLGLLPFYVLEKLLVQLEPQWSWVVPAYLRGARLIRRRRPEVIYSTGGANSAHHAAYLLARRFGLPWIAEIHDPMIHGDWRRSAMAYRFAAWLEGRICRHADDIVDDLGPVPVEVREKALTDFGDRFFADLAAGRSDDPVLKAVVHTVRAFDIDPDCFRRFLHSMAMDLTVDAYATWDDLLGYMDGSAAVIGEMMLPVLRPS